MIIERTVKTDGACITRRATSDMASEWLLHNIVYDATNSYVEYPRVEFWNDSATSAFIDFKTEERPIIEIGSKILEIWGMR